MKRLLTIGHSYVVGQNRRLAHEMALAGAGQWEVTAAAPAALPGDLRPITLEPIAGERPRLAPLTMRAASWPHLRTYRGLQALMREPWDVVHCWEEPYVAAGWQVASAAPRGSRLVVATFQNIDKRYPPPFSWMERRVISRANGWIAFGRLVHETLLRRPGFHAPAAVVPPGVDTIAFAPDRAARTRIHDSLGWSGDVPVLGFSGRFIPEKGLDLLLRALPRLRHAWRALFVGGGPMAAALEAFRAAHAGRVRVVTGVAHDDVPAYLNAMDVLCAPSETTSRWREQFGRMLIEAMACGVTVAGSDSGEIPHVIADRGLVLPERDVDAWTAGLDALLADGPRRSALAAAGLARARAEFAWPVVARRHLAFFESVLAA